MGSVTFPVDVDSTLVTVNLNLQTKGDKKMKDEVRFKQSILNDLIMSLQEEVPFVINNPKEYGWTNFSLIEYIDDLIGEIILGNVIKNSLKNGWTNQQCKEMIILLCNEWGCREKITNLQDCFN
jgi:hypothetical protein